MGITLGDRHVASVCFTWAMGVDGVDRREIEGD
jgi:hypothetical protein